MKKMTLVKTLIAAACLNTVAFVTPASAGSEPFIGEIQWFAGNFAPRGWAKCDGQLLAISQNQALFSIIGTMYGGDGRTTFALPDMRGRAPLHAGNGPGLTPRTQGAKAGSESNTLTTANLPPHSHSLNAYNGNGADNTPADRTLANIRRGYSSSSANTTMDSSSISSTGNGTPVNNMQPYQVLNCIIALQGVYPSRN